MSTNNYRPHVLVLPEDDANRQIANGFQLDASINLRKIQVLPPAGGWPAVRDSFPREHNAAMRRFPNRHMVLLVDFDGRGKSRFEQVMSEVDPSIIPRVFVLGASSEPEDLPGASYEAFGKQLAEDCARGTDLRWSHPLLGHNAPELVRLRAQVRPILF